MNICLTGVSRGLGLALARELLKRGHHVWGVARADSAPRGLSDAAKFTYTSVDVSTPPSLESWRKEMEGEHFTPDIVILNASIQLDDLKDGGYDHALGMNVIDVNVQGALACVGQLLPTFLRRKRGRFVLIGSSVSLRPSVRSAAYAASKAGMSMAFRTLRLKYEESGVGFATVTLGPIATEMWEGRRSWLVSSADQAAARIADFAVGKGAEMFYPFLSMLLLRLSLCLPDSVFAAVSGKVMK